MIDPVQYWTMIFVGMIYAEIIRPARSHYYAFDFEWGWTSSRYTITRYMVCLLLLPAVDERFSCYAIWMSVRVEYDITLLRHLHIHDLCEANIL